VSVLSLLAKKPPAEGYWPLDFPLIRLSPKREDVFTIEQSFQGIMIFGSNGSGKSSGSAALLARKYLANQFGGLVLCAKTDEADRWRSYLRQTGREQDGRFFSVGGEYRFNFLEHEANQRRAQVENLVNLLIGVARVRRSKIPDEKTVFWTQEQKKLFRNGLSLLMFAKETANVRNLSRILRSCPETARDAENERWQEDNYVCALLSRAITNAPQNLDVSEIEAYYLRDWPTMRESERSLVKADLTGLLDGLSRGDIGDLFSTTTNLTPNDILNGAVVVVDIPEREFLEIGQYCALIWLQLLQRAIDRRQYKEPEGRPLFIWQDECHLFASDRDSVFQATCRSKGVSVVRICQNYPLLHLAYGSKEAVDSLLGNCTTKFFHRNDCPETNTWATKLIAKELSFEHSIGDSDGKRSINVHRREEDSCRASEFLALKDGGKVNRYLVQAIVFQSGRSWLKGKRRWIVSEFRQQ
jgi:hypothetical protein